MEYYFSDENLPADKFLMKYVSKDKDGYGKEKFNSLLVWLLLFMEALVA